MRAHLNVLGLDMKSPEYREAEELFLREPSPVKLDAIGSEVFIRPKKWKGPRRCRMSLMEAEDLSVQRLVASLVNVPEAAAALSDGRFTSVVDRALTRAGVEIFPVSGFDVSGERRGRELTAVQKICVLLCTAEALLEADDSDSLYFIDSYSRGTFRKRGYTPEKPLDVVASDFGFVLERALRTLPDWSAPDISESGAREGLLDLAPAAVGTGGLDSAWMQLIPYACRFPDRFPEKVLSDEWSSLDGEYYKTAEPREVLAKLAVREERWAAKTKKLIAKLSSDATRRCRRSLRPPGQNSGTRASGLTTRKGSCSSPPRQTASFPRSLKTTTS